MFILYSKPLNVETKLLDVETKSLNIETKSLSQTFLRVRKQLNQGQKDNSIRFVGKIIKLARLVFSLASFYVIWKITLCYLNPQMFLMAWTSFSSTCFSMSSGRLQKKSMPVFFSKVLMLTT